MGYYDSKHTGAEIDEAIELVRSGEIITDNMSHNVGKDINIPVSGNGVYVAINEAKTELNAQIEDKVDKVDGKGLSTNDYDDEAKAEVAKVKGKQDKLVVSTLDNGNIKVEGLGEFMAATPSGNPNHNLYVSLGANWDGSTWVLNGVELTNEEINVSYLCSLPYLHRIESSAWGNMNTILFPKFKTNFYTIGQIPYNATTKVFDGNGIGYASKNLEVVRFQSNINQTTYKTYVKNCSYMFGNCPKLREIKDYLDVSQSGTFASAFGYQTTSLETIWLIGLNASIDFSGTSVLKKECLLYMIQNAAPTTAITITVHADVYAWASTDAEVQKALTAQPLITLIPA